jgi:transcriptional regulator ATRX
LRKGRDYIGREDNVENVLADDCSSDENVDYNTIVGGTLFHNYIILLSSSCLCLEFMDIILLQPDPPKFSMCGDVSIFYCLLCLQRSQGIKMISFKGKVMMDFFKRCEHKQTPINHYSLLKFSEIAEFSPSC